MDLLDKTWVKRFLFLVVPAVIFALTSAAIRVSQLGIDHTIVVKGTRALVADGPAAFRISLISDDGGFFPPNSLAGRIVRDGVTLHRFDGDVSKPSFSTPIHLRVPRLDPGPASLELTVQFDERRRLVSVPIELVSHVDGESLVVPDDVENPGSAEAVQLGAHSVEAFTADRGAPSGLASVVYLRSTDESGQPISQTLELAVVGISGDVVYEELARTDRLGLFAFSAKPLGMDLHVHLKGADPLALPVIYCPLVAAVHDPLVKDGDPLRVTLTQTAGAGPVFMDVYHEGRLVFGASSRFVDGKAAFKEYLPVQGLVRLQFYTSPHMAGDAVAVRHLYFLQNGDTLHDGLIRLFDLLRRERPARGQKSRVWLDAAGRVALGRTGYDVNLASAFALARLYEGHAALETLMVSRREDDAQLAAFKARFQRGVMAAILLVGLAVVVLIGSAAGQARRRQRALVSMIEEDAPELVSSRWQGWGQALALLLIVLGAFASVALLVSTLTWGG